ncbi:MULTISPECIES: ABC transporter substrate-binding protein [unclassified Mesotoga]|jgi:multiple sugar transport system substrate-binding protein|uniref:ABC transporter substrate-binding protein n=1 Tax=unclassified Mesotoga TaxID=1184398 RepID=UPI001BD59721|nr:MULTISPECIES: ABC transporter substrate-binding protein [unclassified Mesotoga]
MKKIVVVAVLLVLSIFALAKTELAFWYAWGGDEGKALLALVDEFNASQNEIVVRPVFVPIGQGEKINTALAGSSTPDVVTIWDWMVVPLGESGALIPLNDYLDSAGIDESDYLPGVWSYGAYRGTKYGLPTTLNAYAFMWNKALFEEVGVDPDRPPENIKELDEYAELLFRQDTRGNIRRLGFLPNISHIYFYVFGGQLWNPETEEITADHPGNVAALEWVASYYKKFDLQKIRVFQATWGEMASPYNPFYRGQLAIQEAGQWELLFIKQFAKSDFEYGVSPFPAPEGGREKVAYLNGSFWAIPKGSKHPDESFKFLNWLTDSSQAARFAAELSNIPPRVEAIDDPLFQSKMLPNMEIYIDMLTDGYVYFFPTLPIGLYYMEELNQALQYVQSGAKTAEQALNDVQQAVIRELERYR